MRWLWVMVMMVLASVSANAGFDPAVWPMYEHPAKTDQVESNMVAEVIKRQASIGTHSNDYVHTSWWRSRSGNLQAIKTAVKGMMTSGYFVQYNEIGGDVHGILVASNTVPVYNASNVVSSLTRWGLPTNFFSYTPWRDLSGVGGYTYDQGSVGRPHGATNTQTAAGGPLPEGRNRWYTTDYGWDGLRTVVSNLVAVRWAYSQSNVGHGPFWGYDWWNYDPDRTYADAIANAVSRWNSYENYYFHKVGQYNYVRVDYKNYIIDVMSMSHTGICNGASIIPVASTGYVDSVKFHLFVDTSDAPTGAGTNFVTFYGHSYGWETNWIEKTATVLSNGRPTCAFTDSASPTEWPSLPGTNSVAVMGWNINSSSNGHVVVKYNY